MGTQIISGVFQSSFELTGYITNDNMEWAEIIRLFQSSFELTGYITESCREAGSYKEQVSKLFRAYGLYNSYIRKPHIYSIIMFQSSFELTGYITYITISQW